MMNPTKNRKSLFIKCGLGAISLLLFLWLLVPAGRLPSMPYSIQKNDSSDTPSSEHCSTPHPGRPLVQYAVMIDAGSSGSRVHVYRFNYCKEEPEMEDEVFEMLKPGLSEFPEDPIAAANSLRPLMETAVASVPAELQHCTPIAVKATAGLRMLGADKSAAILEAVRSMLENEYPFPITPNQGVEIMEGRDEGVYAWITVNYLLGKLKRSAGANSAAIFDLGGASTQIVFEPTFLDSKETIVEGEHKYTLDYGHSSYALYQHSYLGYGLNEARKRVKEGIIELWKEEALATRKVFHPCLPVNHTESVPYTAGNKTITVELTGTGAGHAACRAVVERVFNKEKACEQQPCAFDGMYQPPLTDTFKDRDLYVFSYFYDLSQPLGMPTEFSVAEYGDIARQVCAGETDGFKHVPQAVSLIESTPDYCLDLTYTHGLLRIGYEIPPERLVRTAKKIAGAETGWCLGAAIAMVDGVSVCRL